ncbi:hypothetical protein [Enterococcus sp. CSURQ0835]|uniref:hypothetical protein n=1 Tax=Enterococcus sp. CSURQ0835 TaxID=2681394 RepID=UPI00135A047A|nr:hypothetical protein [Enterococcus sp. CSURQ0835]
MNKSEKTVLVLKQRQLSLKMMYFNRYLFIRYLTAGFFFSNLYWTVLLFLTGSKLWGIPLLLLLASLSAIAEQTKLYRQPKNTVPWTKGYYWLQIVSNVLVLLAIWTPAFNVLFSFIEPGNVGRALSISLLTCGVLFALLVEQRLKKIQDNRDQPYQQIKAYESILDLSEENE